MKVFISQPMAGKSRDDILAVRRNIKKDLLLFYPESEVEIIDSFFDTDNSMRPMELLGMSITMMASADLVIMAEGWEEARGCRIEKQCADDYGITVMYFEEGDQKS